MILSDLLIEADGDSGDATVSFKVSGLVGHASPGEELGRLLADYMRDHGMDGVLKKRKRGRGDPMFPRGLRVTSHGTNDVCGEPPIKARARVPRD